MRSSRGFKIFYWVMMIASVMGVIFGLIREEYFWALVNAGLGAWFYKDLITLKRQSGE